MNRPKMALLFGTVLILLGSSLAYGGMVAWAMALTAIAVGLLLALWVVLSSTGIVAMEVGPARFAWQAIAILTVIIWIAVQSYLPLPLDIAHPGWLAARELIPDIESGLITVDPVRGTESLIRLLTYIGMFWLVVQLTRDQKRANLLLSAICGIGGLLALIGLVAHLNGPILVPWFPDQTSVVRGPFVNRNNFATLCGMTIIVALGLLVQIRDKERRRSRRESSPWRLVARGLLNGGWFYLTIIIVLFMALVLSGSRAGMAVSVAGVLMLLALNYFTEKRSAGRTGHMFLVVAILVLGTFAWSGDFLATRVLDGDLITNARFDAYPDVAKAMLDFPLTGVGYGAFAQAYPIYRGEDVGKLRLLLENTYLETIFELGAPMAVLWFGVVGSLLYRCFKGTFQRGRDRIYPLIAAAAGTLATIHAFFDYSLQIPAVALLFATILAIGVAQSWPSRDS